MIIAIKDVYTSPVGEFYTILGKISLIEPKRIKPELVRTKLRITDGSASIDIVVFYKSTPADFFLEETIVAYGKLQQIDPKPPYTTPYTSLLVKITDLKHAPSGGAGEPIPLPDPVVLPPLGIKSSNPDLLMETAPPIEFNDEHYLPTPRIGSLLVELYALLGKYVKEMEKK